MLGVLCCYSMVGHYTGGEGGDHFRDLSKVGGCDFKLCAMITGGGRENMYVKNGTLFFRHMVLF